MIFRIAAAAVLLLTAQAAAADLAPSYQEVCKAEDIPEWAYGKDGTPVQFRPLFGCDDRFGARRDHDEQFVEKLQARGKKGTALSWELVRLGWKWIGAQKPSSALNRFNLAFEADPRNGDVYHGIAVVMDITAQSPDVVEFWFRRAVAEDAGQPGRFADYGRFLNTQKRYDEALPVLEKALALEPVNAWTMMNLATLHLEQGDLTRACAMIQRIGTAFPPPGYPKERFQALVDQWQARGEKAGCS